MVHEIIRKKGKKEAHEKITSSLSAVRLNPSQQQTHIETVFYIFCMALAAPYRTGCQHPVTSLKETENSQKSFFFFFDFIFINRLEK